MVTESRQIETSNAIDLTLYCTAVNLKPSRPDCSLPHSYSLAWHAIVRTIKVLSNPKRKHERKTPLLTADMLNAISEWVSGYRAFTFFTMPGLISQFIQFSQNYLAIFILYFVYFGSVST